jgi:FkbH-like protein
MANFLKTLQERLSAKPASLTDIFHMGEQIAQLAGSAEATSLGVPTQRIAVIGATTTDFLCRAIACAVVQEGVLPVLYQGPYGAWIQEVLNSSSALHAYAPNVVVIAPDWRDLVEDLPLTATHQQAAEVVLGKVRLIRQMWDTLAKVPNCRIIQHTLVPPAHRYCALAEQLAPGSILCQVQALNASLLTEGRGRVHWVDLLSLAHELGLQRWAPSRFYYRSKLGFDQRFLADYMPVFRGAWRAAFGRTKKVLVLDLDDTLWGGVIGDDGVDGILLGAGSPEGDAFEAWQRYLKELSERGVVLAVCSKNAAEIAETGFSHPHTRLKKADFSAFVCSWNDKAQGLRQIGRELNLDIDSFVFADDNPAECALIRRALPEIEVVSLGADPAEFINVLEAGHWFDLAAYTAEDLNRTQAYNARRQADEIAVQATNIADYLRDLKMIGQLYNATEADIERIAQLEQKTSQFNMTTRRYSESAIRAFLARRDVLLLAFRLSDRFGDHGLVSTLLAIQEADSLRIDSWVMSCRIFSRTAEQFILQELISLAHARGVRRLIGEYIATPKNAVVASLYTALGFTRNDSGLLQLNVHAIDNDKLRTQIVSMG